MVNEVTKQDDFISVGFGYRKIVIDTNLFMAVT